MSTILILLLSLVCFSITLLLATRTVHNPGARSLILFAIAGMAAALTNFFIYSTKIPFRNSFSIVLFLSVLIAHCALVVQTLKITNQTGWLSVRRLALLGVVPVFAVILSILPAGGNLFQNELIPAGAHLLAPDNPAGLITTLFINILLLVSLFSLARFGNFSNTTLRRKTLFHIAGLAAALLINNNFFSSNYASFHELKIYALILCALGLITGLNFPSAPAPQVQISRASVLEFMNDGVIVLDNSNRIVDINSAAVKIIGIPGQQLIGQPAEEIFIDWPNLTNSLDDTRDLNLKGSVKINERWTYLNIHISPLKDAKGSQFGKLIIWRDITEHRVAEDARQQARDEMFILLHSITSAASRALNLDDFLAESIYQIVYSSHSQSIAVYLLEEHARSTGQRHLMLAAHHGFSFEPESPMTSIPESSQLATWIMEHREPLLIPNIQMDPRFPEQMQAMGPMTLLMLPMMMEGQTLGLISLTRTGTNPYTPEEIARLSAVTDEVATFIYSNRQRQLSIALGERQRLVRDLHDSVTQRLYALVMLAEATQAGIQAGVTDMPEKVIVRMAESARQALKEMRLFLFQMQPVDFARDGLVSALRQRLSAVEGRADINARLSADDEISLPLEKELALYFIAQEALNNVLKHAKAKKVTVNLHNRGTNFVLEVEDNGCGFDPRKTTSGGIGMKSMRERAEQIGGKLKISSSPGKGTKIMVTMKNNLAREKMPDDFLKMLL